MLRKTATVFLMASALVGLGVLAATATTATTGSDSCPHGRAAVIDVAYVIFHADGTSNNVTTLRGNVRLGDTVNALFNVPALPSGCAQVEISLASYSSSAGPAIRNLALFSSESLEFLPGGRYELSVTVAPAPPAGAPAVFFRLYFATGPVLIPPHYGPNRIASAKN